MGKKPTGVDNSVLEVAVEKAVKKYVNGKIDRLQKCMDLHNVRHEADMAEIKPFLLAAKDIAAVVRVGKWIGGIGLGFAAAWITFRSAFGW